MKPLGTSLPPPTGSSSECDNSTSGRAKYAAERARLLFGCYRRGDANDPETYVAAVAAVLSAYPEETMRFVTDPRSGLPGQKKRDPKTGQEWSGLPDVADVRSACEAHHGTTKRMMEWERAAQQQIEDRKRLAITDNRPRKTYEELIADCQAKGLNIGPKKPSIEAIDGFLHEHGVTREQFDAMPDLPVGHGERR